MSLKICDFQIGDEAIIEEGISSSIVSKLLDDFGIPPETVELIGAKKSEHQRYIETVFLYKFPKTSDGIGLCLRVLGTMVDRIPLKPDDDFGIQEVDLARPDGYYISFYLLENNPSYNNRDEH